MTFPRDTEHCTREILALEPSRLAALWGVVWGRGIAMTLGKVLNFFESLYISTPDVDGDNNGIYTLQG